NLTTETQRHRVGSVERAGRLAPGEFADVEIPVTTIGDADGFLFEFVNYFIDVDMFRENVHEQISGADGEDARPLVGSAKKGGFDSVNGVNVAGDARDTIFVGLDGAGEMAVGFAFESSTVDDMEFFAWF